MRPTWWPFSGIDAVCVDQWNLPERGQQVKRMGDVFRLAQHVIVWLGEEDHSSRNAFESLRSLCSQAEVNWVNGFVQPKSRQIFHNDVNILRKPLPLAEGELESMLALLCRAWFERLWIRQEIRLSNRDAAVVVCGSDAISWKDFGTAVLCMSDRRKTCHQNEKVAAEWHQRVHIVRDLVDDIVENTMDRIVHMSRVAKCSDPRDRIYSALTLLQMHHPMFKIDFDYTRPVNMVYTDATMRWVRYSKSLNILRCCELETSEESIPSWVPNWKSESIAELLWHAEWASGVSLAAVQFQNTSQLRVTGVDVSSIRAVNQLDIYSCSTYDNVVRKIMAMSSDAAKSRSTLGGRATLDTICRTICCNNFSDHYVPHHKRFPVFDAALETLQQWLAQTAAETNVIDTSDTLTSYDLYRVAKHYLRGRSYIITSDGRFGIAPRAAKKDDIVVVLLGCNVPLLLRPISSRAAKFEQKFRIVGSCYIVGLMNNEALLGPLPSHYEPIRVLENKTYHQAFFNKRIGQLEKEDPRLTAFQLRNLFPEELAKASRSIQDGDPRLSVETLRERGVALSEFTIV